MQHQQDWIVCCVTKICRMFSSSFCFELSVCLSWMPVKLTSSNELLWFWYNHSAAIIFLNLLSIQIYIEFSLESFSPLQIFSIFYLNRYLRHYTLRTATAKLNFKHPCILKRHSEWNLFLYLPDKTIKHIRLWLVYML
jgi:hypothetical protein